jgi:hypothetical protein
MSFVFFYVVYFKCVQCVCFTENLYVTFVLSEETLPIFFHLHNWIDYSVACCLREISSFFLFSLCDLCILSLFEFFTSLETEIEQIGTLK